MGRAWPQCFPRAERSRTAVRGPARRAAMRDREGDGKDVERRASTAREAGKHMRDEIQPAGIVEDAAADTTCRPQPPRALSSPWVTAEEAAERARCGIKIIYREV